MKNFKRMLSLTIILLICFSSISVFAENEAKTEIIEIKDNSSYDEVSPQFINEYRYRKVNVSTYETWSEYKRVSDNLTTGDKGGSIVANKSVSFNSSVQGKIYGLNISLGRAVTSSKGYTLNIGANKTMYMAYRVKYKVETGTREHYDMVTGKVIGSSRYTVKIPQYGDYRLIND